MADFSGDVTRWVNKAKDKGNLLFAKIAMAVDTRIKELTPVKTGFLRANWIVTTHLSDQSDLAAALVDTKIGETIYIVNHVVYARRVEYGFVGTDSLGRHYNQQGHHMVQQTMAELPQIIKKAVQEVRNA